MRILNWSLALALAAALPALAKTSHDGTCGGDVSCMGSHFGNCCGPNGKCGASRDYCGYGCQTDFGWCASTKGRISPDRTCGGDTGYVCKDSKWGDCCSPYGYCGSSDDYCGTGCKGGFGTCHSPQNSTSSNSTSSTSSLSANTTSKVGARAVLPTSLPTALSCPGSNGTIYTATSGETFRVECYIDHEGGDMEGNPIYTESLEKCIATCDSEKGCVDVSWVNGTDNGPCYLKKALGKAATASHVWGAVKVYPVTVSPSVTSYALPTPTGLKCPQANNTIYQSDCGSEFLVECSVDRYGGDISGGLTYVDGIGECAAACAKNSDCVAAAWHSGSPGPCYLKESLGSAVSKSTVHGVKLVSGCTTSSLLPTAISLSSTSLSLSTPSATSVSSLSISLSSISVSASPSSLPTVSVSSTSLSTLSAPSVSSLSISVSSSTISNSVNSTTTGPSSTITNSANLTSTLSSATLNATSTAANATSTSSKACTTQASSTAICVPCEGQGGSLPYCGADISTNHYNFVPKTCNTVTYNFDITNTTLSPDGIERIVLLVNGQMPGPTIEANWGDTIIVTVNNKLQDNGTSIHFHGIRQNYTNEYDGVPSITQCPIAPGESMTYQFVATNYGTSWYHSHFAIQAWEGVFGPMIIHGPTSQDFDVDAGTIMLQDWTHVTVDSMYDAAQDAVNGGPRTMDNGLINGLNTWGADGTSNQTGSRFELPTKFVSGQTYLLRIINAAIQSTYKFYLDGHSMTVISMDFVPIKPYKTNILNINIGQRYMVLVEADQPVNDYWMRSDNQNACAATTQALDIKGIVRYDGSNGSTPTTTAYDYTGECIDEPYASLVPYVSLDAGDEDEEENYDVTISANSANLFKWYLSGTTFQSQYDNPTLYQYYQNGSAPTYSGNLILDIPNENEWVYIIIQSGIALPHPIHLHGHDIFILAEGNGTYDSSVELQLSNPPRRDTALMPAAGYLVVAFQTDNPGAWLMHCHIGWHSSMGFALQFLEMKSKIKGTITDSCVLTGTCDSWLSYADANDVEVEDSGI